MQRRAWVAGLCALLLAGCSSARVIESSATGGCVAISDSSDSWPSYNRTKAFELIGKQCPNGFQVVSEKEVVIGQTTTHNRDTSTKEVPIIAGLAVDVQKTTRNTTDVRDQTEYRIWYQKK